MRVTAAHEFFHAIQFAYDVYEDLWFMEGTATWVEDEVFPAINANFQYLAYSPIRFPRSSADYTSGLHRFGSWALFRFAAEFLHDRTIVRRMWEAADSARGRAYSLQAIRSVVSARTSWPLFFNQFARWNTLPPGSYRERARYPKPVLRHDQVLSAQAPSTGALRTSLGHLASSAMRVTPGSALHVLPADGGGGGRAGHEPGSAALVETRLRDGRVQVASIALDAAGNGSQVVGFDRQQVSSVTVVFAQHQHRHEELREDHRRRRSVVLLLGRGVLDAQPFSVRERLL